MRSSSIENQTYVRVMDIDLSAIPVENLFGAIIVCTGALLNGLVMYWAWSLTSDWSPEARIGAIVWWYF